MYFSIKPNKIVTSICIAATLVISGCNEVKNNKNAGNNVNTLNQAEYLIVQNDALKTSPVSVSGTGSLVFKNPLIEDANNFNLVFRIEDGGSLALAAHASEKLEQGLNVTFTRKGNTLTLSTSSGEKTSETVVLQGMDPAGDIALNLDVHNDESPGHMLIWKNDTTTELVLDSEEVAETAGNGQGQLWGLILKEATVVLAQSRPAAHEE